MKKAWLCAVLALLVAATAPAAEQLVTWKSGDQQASGLPVTPEGEGPVPGRDRDPGVVGLERLGQEHGRAFANEGYLALAVDLYRGKVATT